MAPLIPNPIAALMLDDLRRAAAYLEEIGEVNKNGPIAMEARNHAMRLWAASQVVERLIVGVEQLIIQERSRVMQEGSGES
jgi:hypothetical protein